MKHKILCFIWIILIICLSILATHYIDSEYMFKCNMCDEKFLNNTGVYYANEYYCVLVKGRTIDAIVTIDPVLSRINSIGTTAVHELSHHLINKDKNHFCGNNT